MKLANGKDGGFSDGKCDRDEDGSGGGGGGGDSGGGSKISPDGGALTRVAVKSGDISEETSTKTLRKNHSSFHIPICCSFY